MSAVPAQTVSAVVPTRRRPDLLPRAVASALAQPETTEAVVVIDDADEAHVAATRAALEPLADDRLRVVQTAGGVGNGAARNVGVRHASGDLIAFLDDDDEWHEGKLAAQLAAQRDVGPRLLAVARVRADAGGATFDWPRRLPHAGESVADYLFRPTTLGTGEGMAQTSTWLGPAALFRELAFDENLRRYVDLDWLLRAADWWPDFGLIFAGWPGVLATWDIRPRPRVSTGHDGADALRFADDRRHLLTPGAYAGFVLTRASDAAARDGRRPGFWRLLNAARRHGRPTPAGLASHALQFAVPRGLLDRAAAGRAGKGAACEF